MFFIDEEKKFEAIGIFWDNPSPELFDHWQLAFEESYAQREYSHAFPKRETFSIITENISHS
jgi:hypothetical protein